MAATEKKKLTRYLFAYPFTFHLYPHVPMQKYPKPWNCEIYQYLQTLLVKKKWLESCFANQGKKGNDEAMDKITTEDSICVSDSTDSKLSHTDCCMSGNESSLSAQTDFTDICRDKKTNYRSTQTSYSPYQHPLGPENSRQSASEFTYSGHTSPHPRDKLTPSTGPLSLEQRKVFVTYEADSEKHVKEIINFVALLRHNGFYTHIDMFEQQFKSISKIDFMERYISEKDYLIIIVISPKYHEIATNASFCMENDETLNTVYIYKQLQNEFIQNGARNYRFIPILFPGAKKCHVPLWLQSTQIFTWPRDRDDILRRLMRVEKYNPPPIGELPTIVSIPI
ncbi:hypothetical protein cypCar_00024131 [Cyprinus carpio]|nr:hypothetical protein cypCar_00024131 [Cyprinus carpio]